jgi:predicted transcriptional regulator
MYDETGPDGKRPYTVAQIAEEFGVTRPTIYRHLKRQNTPVSELLPRWLASVDTDEKLELRSFATGIRRDLAAVTAGLTLEHRSGKVEGNVNR